MAQPGEIRQGEEGFMLLAVICLLALLIISLSVALPKISKEIQRDRELETMQRGKQYARGIKMYYKKMGAYPPNLEALTKPAGPGGLRFLRKQYVDPTTGKKEWKIIHFGEAKTQTLGFFGQPISGMGMAGNSLMAGVGPSTGGGLGGSSFGGSGGGLGGSSFGGAGGGLTPSSGIGGAPTDPGSGQGSSGATNPTGTGTGIGGAGGSSMGGQSFGGLGIIGFSPTSQKASILVYKKKKKYSEWEFVYDPLADMFGGGGMPGGPQVGGTGLAPGMTPTTPIGTGGGGYTPSPAPSGSSGGGSASPDPGTPPPQSPNGP
jgi:type II secretory pathway pseudopilin PulG